MTTTASEIVVQSSVSHDVEALVQAAVSVLTNDMQIATHEVHNASGQEQNTVQLLVDSANSSNIQDRLYMCTDCNLAFYGETGEQEWQWHLKQHKPFKCDLCSEGFEHKESLKTHMRAHTMQMPYICDKCGSAYTLKSNLVQHMKSHDETVFQCAECKVLFKSQMNLEKHMKFHTGETIKVYQCEQCSKTFSQQKNLVQHMKIHLEGDKTFKCSECPASYSYKCHLTRHLMIHSGDKPYKCKFCGKAFNRNAHLIRHRKIHSGAEKEWKCNQCGFAFWEKSDLFRHIRSHEGNRPFKCEFCEQTFVWKRYLFKHLNSNHRADDRFFCPDCCKCLSAEEELIEHQNVEHSNKKQLTHTCDVCSQEFYFKYKLDEHMYIHTGRKAHDCDKCPEKFVSRKELDRHLAEHSQEVSFHCNTCDKTFGSIDQLQRHVKLHTGHGKYPCSICGASFRWKSQLSSHMVVHSQDFDFLCSVCNKQFKRKRDLTRHVKIYHDTKPPYTCYECNQDFHSPFNLHKHKSETHWKRTDAAEDFPCRHCSGYFKFKKDLVRHEAKVHPPRPFTCTICEKRFTMMKFLEKHFELHHDGIELMEDENYMVTKQEEVEDENFIVAKQEQVEENIAEEAGDLDQAVAEEFGTQTMEVDETGDTGPYENESETMFVVENVDGVDALTNGELLSQLKQAGDDNQIIVSEAQHIYLEHINSDILQQQPLSEAITLAHLSEQQTNLSEQQTYPDQGLVPMVISMQDHMDLVKQQPKPQVIQVATSTAAQAFKAPIIIPKDNAVSQPQVVSGTQPQVVRIQSKALPSSLSFSQLGLTKTDGGQKINKVFIKRKAVPTAQKFGDGTVKIINLTGGTQSTSGVMPTITNLVEASTEIQLNDVNNTIIAGMVPTTAEDLVNSQEVVEQSETIVSVEPSNIQ